MRFPVSVKSSPLVSSAFVRRRIGLRPTKLLVAREKKTSGTQGTLHWADPGCFHRGVVSTRVQGKRPRAKGMEKFHRYKFEALLLRTKSTVQQRELFVFFVPDYLIKQTSASERAFLDEPLQRLAGISRLPQYMAITARSENRVSSIVDLEQVLIHFISENDRSASALVIGRVQAMTEGDRYLEEHPYRKHQVLVKGCLEAPYLLTARLLSIYEPHFQWS